MIAKERIYLTADKKKVVREGSKRAAFLFAGVGDPITEEDARKYGLIDGRVVDVLAQEHGNDETDDEKIKKKWEEMKQLREKRLIEAGMDAGENGYSYRGSRDFRGTMFAYKEEIWAMDDEGFDVFLKALDMAKAEADKDKETDGEGDSEESEESKAPTDSEGIKDVGAKEAKPPEDKEIKTTENKQVYPAESKRKKVIKKR